MLRGGWEGRTIVLNKVSWPSPGLVGALLGLGLGLWKEVCSLSCFFFLLSAEKTFWEICVEMEHRSQGTVMWKTRDDYFLVTSPYQRMLGTGRTWGPSSLPSCFSVGAKRCSSLRAFYQRNPVQRELTSGCIILSCAGHPDMFLRFKQQGHL